MDALEAITFSWAALHAALWSLATLTSTSVYTAEAILAAKKSLSVIRGYSKRRDAMLTDSPFLHFMAKGGFSFSFTPGISLAEYKGPFCSKSPRDSFNAERSSSPFILPEATTNMADGLSICSWVFFMLSRVMEERDSSVTPVKDSNGWPEYATAYSSMARRFDVVFLFAFWLSSS